MNNNELNQKLQEAKDFWNTPFEQLIEQGYGTIEDPVKFWKDCSDKQKEIMIEDDITLKELEVLLVKAGKPGKAHTKRNVALRQYIKWIWDMIQIKRGFTLLYKERE